MINDENFTFYLRYLVKITETRPILYSEIPKAFEDFFSIPALSQALNVMVQNPPPVNYSKVENYLDSHKFSSFDMLCKGIKDTFDTDMDKLYAAYYYSTHNIEYDYTIYEGHNLFDPTTNNVFKTNKGICGDYTRFFIKIAKKTGVDTDKIRLEFFINVCKGSNWKSYNPPTDKKTIETNLHACVYLEIDDCKYMSEPTWGAGRTKKKVFSYEYRKTYFLVPYYTGLLQHFPYESQYFKQTYLFTLEKFSTLNRVSLEREVSLESNPFQIIKTKKGMLELQFSFVQVSELLAATFQVLDNDIWVNEVPLFSAFTCLEKDIPSRYFTYYPDKKRTRYKFNAYLAKKGTWKIIVFSDRFLFDAYVVLDDFNGSLPVIPTSNDKEENGFFPITPVKGLTTVKEGYTQIRFAINNKRSPKLKIDLYEVKPGTFERASMIKQKIESTFDTELFDGTSLFVEKWIFIEFPSNGRWEVCIYSIEMDDQKPEYDKYTICMSYYFDVTNAGSQKVSPLYGLSKSRKFTSFKDEKISISPSSSSVVLNNFDFNFHVFSEDEVVDYIVDVGDSKNWMKKQLQPQIVSVKDTEEGKIKDREYSIKFPSYGHYKLKLKGKDLSYSQQYFVVDSELQEESTEETDLMKNLEEQIEGEFDYMADIPSSIKDEVDKMIVQAPRAREVNGKQSACCLLI